MLAPSLSFVPMLLFAVLLVLLGLLLLVRMLAHSGPALICQVCETASQIALASLDHRLQT